MKTIKVAALVMVFSFALLVDGCKTHKMAEVTKSADIAVKVDSVYNKQDSVVKDSTATKSEVKQQSKVVEEYSETTITIKAPAVNNFNVPVDLNLDSTSTLDTLKYSNPKNPKYGMTIYTGKEGKAVAEIETPQGKKSFPNFSSITMSSKKWKKTTTGKIDSAGQQVITKILKNSVDSGRLSVDSTRKEQSHAITQKDSKPSFWGLLAAFWWIPLTLAAVGLVLWKWPSIINIFKK
ncbi:hypothetical protein SAMN05192529_13135 [Arachidicoccus rhizosphaerae]|uniref:Uncharacterized protein n=1 Tax=Arachidicoccus rhizosphaerae TaxID=551991 RepID=A0A1H4CG39_9BACT|nr:hypothetical protein [Arachidicoccus rhizosphaerae]SEA59290.1 hypothetical protein SAMN05192529_13135 [Arachidicoccus rhizosphaerae]